VPLTPDRHPGVLDEDEAIQLGPQAVAPSVNGELRYVTGVGFRFFEEGVNKGLTGTGITEGQHENLDTLTHWIAETGYEENTYSGSNLTNTTTWTSAAKLIKVREEQLTYSGNKVQQIVSIQYDAAGVETYRVTEVMTYSGNKITSIARTRV
jgi:hypothetical protein